MGKRGFILFAVLGLLVTILFFGCSKKSDSNPLTPDLTSGYGSITLNGGGYSNTKINFSYGAAAYTSSQSATNCIEYGTSGSDSVMVVVSFTGKATGDYDWDDFSQSSNTINGIIVYVHTSSGTYKYFIPKAGGKTTVSKYGNVGDNIEGTFNGTTADASSSSTTITASGSFKAVRLADE